MAGITFTPEELSKTFQTYRKDFIVMPMLAMSKALQHMSVRTGIRYRETVSEMGGNFELGNYKKDKKGTGDVSITGRVLETFFGNCVEPIDPNAIYQSIWGSNVTKGDGLKNDRGNFAAFFRKGAARRFERRITKACIKTAVGRFDEDFRADRVVKARVHAALRVAKGHRARGVAVVAAQRHEKAPLLGTSRRLLVLQRRFAGDLDRDRAGIRVKDF